MKKAMALLLMVALLSLLLAPAQAAGTLLIGAFAEITKIEVFYTDGSSGLLNLSSLYGSNPTFAPTPPKGIIKADVTCSILRNCFGYYAVSTIFPLTAGSVKTFTVFGGTFVSLSASNTGAPAFLTISLNAIGDLLKISVSPLSPANPNPGPVATLAPHQVYPSSFISERTSRPPQKPQGQRAYIVSGQPVPVFYGPSADSQIIGWAKPGETVYLNRWKNDFCNLLYNNESNLGWVEGIYIRVP